MESAQFILTTAPQPGPETLRESVFLLLLLAAIGFVVILAAALALVLHRTRLHRRKAVRRARPSRKLDAWGEAGKRVEPEPDEPTDHHPDNDDTTFGTPYDDGPDLGKPW